MDVTKQNIQNAFRESQQQAYDLYTMLVEPSVERTESCPYQTGEIVEFPGIARELARTVLPVSNYTELYWKQDLHNLLHLIKLRRDPHAQYEIRVYAEAIYQAIRPLFPATCEAWEDYVWEAVTLSRMEVEAIKILIGAYETPNDDCFAKLGMGKREIVEFKARWNL